MNFYFLLEDLNDSTPTAVNDQHTCVVFAQGLKELGIPYCGNRPFLPKDNAYLITAGEPSDNHTTVIVTACPHKFGKDYAPFRKHNLKSSFSTPAMNGIDMNSMSLFHGQRVFSVPLFTNP